MHPDKNFKFVRVIYRSAIDIVNKKLLSKYVSVFIRCNNQKVILCRQNCDSLTRMR